MCIILGWKTDELPTADPPRNSSDGWTVRVVFPAHSIKRNLNGGTRMVGVDSLLGWHGAAVSFPMFFSETPQRSKCTASQCHMDWESLEPLISVMKWKGPADEPWLRRGTEPCLTILFPLGLLSFAESPDFFSLFVPFSPGVASPCISQFYCAKWEQVAKSWSLTYIPDMLYFKVIHRNSSSVFWGVDWGQWQDKS